MKKHLLLILALLAVTQVFAREDIEVVNIENKAVQEYMADALKTYTSNKNYNYSIVTQYNSSSKYGSKLYWPNGKLVKWTPTTSESNIQEIKIYASENEDYKNAYTFNPDEKSASSYMIRNLLPGKIYYYKVEEILYDGTRTIMAEGKFKTTGQVRMIQVRNSTNVRDLGGWNTQYGCKVKYGKLFRSASLERTNANGRHDFVENLNVRAELDLRHETKRESSPLGSDVKYLRITHKAGTQALQSYYDVYSKDLRWIIKMMKEGRSVDWHCAIGCDRCGTLSFLIEGLLGLNEVDLSRDFELSTFSLNGSNHRPRGHIKGMLSYIKTFGPDDDLAYCFFNYWIAIGMERDELVYFLDNMLDKKVKNDNH